MLGRVQPGLPDGGRGDFDENGVVDADGVEGVGDLEAALDLVGLDHGDEESLDGERGSGRRCLGARRGAAEPVHDGDESAEVVGWVAPLHSA